MTDELRMEIMEHCEHLAKRGEPIPPKPPMLATEPPLLRELRFLIAMQSAGALALSDPSN